MTRIYLDNAATTTIFPEVIEAMKPAWDIGIGNPSSVHAEGQKARKFLEESREEVASILSCQASEITFTSGGTESNNWAIRALASLHPEKKHIISSAIEHPSVLRTCKALEKEGYLVTYLPVDAYGKVSVASLNAALTDETALVSIMLANNEIGTLEPITELAEAAHARGALFHTDAVQAVGSIPVSISDLGVDALSFSAHKFGGPTGIGGLYIRDGLKIPAWILGGEQEYGKRAGTENLAGALGMAKALALSTSDIEKRISEIAAIRDTLIAQILEKIDGAKLCGHPVDRLPGNAHFVFEGVDGEALLLYLNLEGYACSSGSACTSGKNETSHVLKAIGLSEQEGKSALRISIGPRNTEDEVLSIVPVIERITTKLRNR